jgi:hypothetical protein
MRDVFDNEVNLSKQRILMLIPMPSSGGMATKCCVELRALQQQEKIGSAPNMPSRAVLASRKRHSFVRLAD